jgi:hypothetical protein
LIRVKRDEIIPNQEVGKQYGSKSLEDLAVKLKEDGIMITSSRKKEYGGDETMQEIELSAGIIEYEDTGGSGPIIVLLHGLLLLAQPLTESLRIC